MPATVETLRSWHDFFLGSSAASATFAGLLFVGISIHVRAVASHPDVRQLARITLSTFFTVVVVSLVMLVPSDRASYTGFMLLAAAVIALIVVIPSAVHAMSTDRRSSLARRTVFARFGLALLTYIALAVTSAMILAGSIGDGLQLLVGVLFVMLVVAIRNTWDLLVTLATTESSRRDT